MAGIRFHPYLPTRYTDIVVWPSVGIRRHSCSVPIRHRHAMSQGEKAMKSTNMMWAGICAVGVLASEPVAAQELTKVTMVVFEAPSLGAFLPPIVKAQKFDAKNGLDITFVSRSPDAYIVQFNT